MLLFYPTALETKPWEDILYIQAKLVQLRSKYLSLEKAVEKKTQIDPQGSGSVHGPGVDQMITPRTNAVMSSSTTAAGMDEFCSDPLPPGSTSLDEWASLAKLKSQVEHKKWELEYLKDVEQNVLPHVFGLLQELLSSSPQATQQAVAMIRVIHLLFVLPSRPMYVFSDQSVD